jgi:hypothetical protein
MVRVRNGNFEGISKHRRGFREPDAVLLEVFDGLARIPLEFHDASLPSSPQLGLTPGFSRGATV